MDWVYLDTWYWDLRYCTSMVVGNTVHGCGFIW